MRHLLLVLPLYAACNPEPLQCGSTQGFLFGTVTGGIGDVTVQAVPVGGGTTVNAESLGGDYEINLEGGTDWVIFAFDANGCASDDVTVSVEACTEDELDFTIDELQCDTADKPNLYLYPGSDTATTVQIVHDPDQAIFQSDPPYVDGWRGVAHPDGTFSPEGGERAPFLFYEITLRARHTATFQRSQRLCVDGGAQAARHLADVLASYGFTAREQQDFVDGWQQGLPDAPRLAVYPQTQVSAAAGVVIAPDLPLSRLWLLVEPDATCVPAGPAPEPFDRQGAHAVEWGVVVRGA